MKEIPHCNLSDDVDFGIITQEEANKIAEQMAERKAFETEPLESEEEMELKILDEWWELEKGNHYTIYLGS